MVGGAAVTEEFHPGFRNSVAAYTVSLLNPKVIRDLRLLEHGLKIVERRAQNFLPAPDGRYLLAAEGRTEGEIAKFSIADAGRFAEFNREIDAAADVLRALVLKPPPNLTEGFNLESLHQFARLGALGNKLRRLPMKTLRAVFDLFTKSAGDYLDSLVRERPAQGPVRLRCGGRELREPLYAGHRPMCCSITPSGR